MCLIKGCFVGDLRGTSLADLARKLFFGIIFFLGFVGHRVFTIVLVLVLLFVKHCLPGIGCMPKGSYDNTRFKEESREGSGEGSGEGFSEGFLEGGLKRGF